MAYLQVTYVVQSTLNLQSNGCWDYKEEDSCVKKQVQIHHKEEVYDKKRK